MSIKIQEEEIYTFPSEFPEELYKVIHMIFSNDIEFQNLGSQVFINTSGKYVSRWRDRHEANIIIVRAMAKVFIRRVIYVRHKRNMLPDTELNKIHHKYCS